MRYFISLFIILILFSCSGNGLEGFVNEPITITALDPDEGQDYDYFWSVENQPDGSLINSSDLNTSNGGKEMVFTPDYPGNYSIELNIKKYGDEVDVQKFLFTILDQEENKKNNDLDDAQKEEENNEDWLDDEYEDDEYEDDEYEDDEYEDDEYEDDEYEDDEYEDDEYEDDEYEDNEYEDDEYEETENSSITTTKTKFKNKTTISSKVSSAAPNKLKSLAEKTDRFTIQITSKKKLKDAQTYSKTLLKKGYDVYMQKIILDNSETWYRVRLGSYDDYNAAKKDARIISKELGFTVWVDFVRKEQK